MIELENFPESRYRHCYSVGKKMYTYAKNVLKWDENKCIEMFVLGNIHDIGYELNEDSFKHGDTLYDALKGNYNYAKEVKYHNELQETCLTPEMKLLYFADATVDGMGNWVTFQERTDDLIKRYSEDSKVVEEFFEIVEALKKWGYDDTL